MIHSNQKCRGNIVIDCSSFFTIQSPSIKITSRGVQPGIIQIDAGKSKSTNLMCFKCGEVFSTKKQLDENILDSCSICGESFQPSKLYIIDNGGGTRVCEKCKSGNSDNEKVLALYGQFLKKAKYTNLLDILTINK